MQKMNDNELYCYISHCITIATIYIIIAILAEVLVKFKGERNTHSTDFHLKFYIQTEVQDIDWLNWIN